MEEVVNNKVRHIDIDDSRLPAVCKITGAPKWSKCSMNLAETINTAVLQEICTTIATRPARAAIMATTGAQTIAIKPRPYRYPSSGCCTHSQQRSRFFRCDAGDGAYPTACSKGAVCPSSWKENASQPGVTAPGRFPANIPSDCSDLRHGHAGANPAIRRRRSG